MSRTAKTVAPVAAGLAAILSFVLIPARYSRADDVIPEYARGTPVPEAQFCPTSPDVRAMIRYGNGTSVNMYTGAATYTINLYTYRDRDFTIPVSISYRGDGFRPGRAPGTVGTGWYLNAGGVITREIRGLPDEATSYTYASKTEGDCSIDDVFTIAAASGLDHGVLKRMLYDYSRSRSVNVFGFGARKFSSGQMKSADYAYSGEIGREYVLFQEEIASSSARKFETESDLYHFSFMGYSGSFVLGDDGECIVLNSDSPAGEIQITYNYDRYSPLRTTFTITTGDGYEYTFGCIDTCSSWSSWGADAETPESESSISCWRLTGMESDIGMTASFTYGTQSDLAVTSNAVCLDDLTLTDVNGNRQRKWAGSSLCRTGTVTNSISRNLLTRITIGDRAVIRFTYDESDRLESVLVNNGLGNRVRYCDMTYAPAGAQSLLKTVSVSGEGVYAFGYYDEDRDSDDFPRAPTWKEDWYGYCSRNVQIPEYVSGSIYSFAGRLKSSRNVFDFEGTRFLMLKRITYPTGGYSDYSYEQNSYSGKAGRVGALAETVTGGIRVSRIDTYDSNDSLRTSRRFRYITADGECSGTLYEEPAIYFRYRLESPTLTIEREAASFVMEQVLEGHIGYSRVLEEVSDMIGGEVRSVSERRFLLRTAGPYEETYSRSASEIVTSDGWNFTFNDLGSDFPESMRQNGPLCDGLISGTTVYAGTAENGCKVSDTVYGMRYWSPSGTDVAVTRLSILQGRVFDRSLYRRSVYVGTRATTSYGSDHAPMATVQTEVSGLTVTGRPSSFTSTDSRGREVVTGITYRDDRPARMSGRTVTAGGKTVSDEQYGYGYFTVNGRSRLLPSSVKRGLIASDGSVTGYETALLITGYDEYGNPAEVEDALGNAVTYRWGYSGLHLTMKTMTVSGHRLAWFWTWKPLLGMTSETLPDLTETDYGLDGFGRLTSVIESGNVIGKYEYNIVNQ